MNSERVPFTSEEVELLVGLGCRVLGYNPKTGEDRNIGKVAPNGFNEFGRIDGYVTKTPAGFVWVNRYSRREKTFDNLLDALHQAGVPIPTGYYHN